MHLEQGFLTVNETTDVAVHKLVHSFVLLAMDLTLTKCLDSLDAQ